MTVEMNYQWMPFTANKDFKSSPRMVARAQGLYYYTDSGRPILDGSSGLFTCAAGHSPPEIVAAISRQAAELDYIPHFNTATVASFKLAELVGGITPERMDKVFFTNSGSEAIDSSMKIVMAYHKAKGNGRKTRFVSRELSYHGVNLGGTSLSGMINNRRDFEPTLPGVVHLRHTRLEQNRFSKGVPKHGGADLAEDLQRFVDLYGAENIAACYVEPVAGSVGVIVPPEGYLERLREICTANDIVLVFDEVITGFGRTGAAFASHSFGVTPDVMTLAKALTNGSVPMGAVVVNNDIYDAVVDSKPELATELFHGYTYSAHPLACAAGIAALELYQRENLFVRANDLSGYFLDSVFALADEFDCVIDARGCGLLAAVDLAPGEAPGLRGRDFYQSLFQQGLHIKTTMDTAIIAPALIAREEDIDNICGKLREQLKTY